MMMEAVLSNADHPEYGVATIPLPIPRNQYDHCVALLEALEIGDASEADCRLDSLDSALPVLNRLVCTKVNLDELDYSQCCTVSEENFQNLVKTGCQPQSGDVLLVKDGATTGRVGMMTDDTAGPQSQSKALSGKFGISRRLNLSDAEIMRLTGLARNTYYKYKRELRGK